MAKSKKTGKDRTSAAGRAASARALSSRAPRSRPSARRARSGAVRYAVVGLGHVAQAAVLPAFKHARNSRLTALVSDDPTKLRELGKKYAVDPDQRFSYDEYEDCLRSGAIDAVYIALPNSMHAEFAVRAADAGIHILCEKPMAVTEEECRRMIDAAASRVKLMIAYRLHFEEANLRAVEIVRSGKLGEARLFTSTFSMQVKEGNIRTQAELGGGTLYDIGIYCINAARSLFQAEPLEVAAFSARRDDARFEEIDEMTSAVMRFPDERLATFTSSFGAADVAAYQVVGTRGDLRVNPAYEYASALKHELTIGGKTKERKFAKRDQFGPELLYFSNCIINDETPEPDGAEGLADVRVIRALYQSARIGRPVRLEEFDVGKRPGIEQEIKRPPVKEPELVHAESAAR